MKKIKNYCSIFVIIAVFFLFVSCDLFSSGNYRLEELKINASETEVEPGGKITITAEIVPRGVTSDSIVWFVNSEQQAASGTSYELSMERTEKRYEVKAQCVKNNTTFTSNVIICYGSEN